MTKNLLIVAMFFFGVFKLQAQCTPDNTITVPGFYPNTLPDAYLQTDYSEIIQFKIVKDTNVVFAGNPVKATIDSAIVIGVTGMPPGITFQLNKVSKSYTPAEVGCALVSGKPTNNGTFKLKIILRLYAKVSGFPVSQVDTIKNFAVTVRKDAAIDLISSNTAFVFPNPLIGNRLNLKLNESWQVSKLHIYTSCGQVLETRLISPNEEVIEFDYPKGFYLLGLETSAGILRTRLLKQ
jgi:hypothetical protein